MAQWSVGFLSNESTPTFLIEKGVHSFLLSTSKLLTLQLILPETIPKSSTEPFPVTGSYLVGTLKSFLSHMTQNSPLPLFFQAV